MCSDWSALAAAWLLAAAITSVASFVTLRSTYVDGNRSAVLRGVVLLLGAAGPVLFLIALGSGVNAVAGLRAGPSGLHGVELFWGVVSGSRSTSIASVLAGTFGTAVLAAMRGPSRSRIIGLGVIAVTLGLLGMTATAGASPLCEALVVVREIQVAQEAHRAEKGTYANVSTGLGANQATNHHALYPSWPDEPHSQSRRWNVPCDRQVCSSASGWAVLPIHVDAPVAFGYSTIAGRAGERPAALVTIGGKRVEWPLPERDWYIVTAVGDPTGTGRFMTVVGSSFTTQLLIDRGDQ